MQRSPISQIFTVRRLCVILPSPIYNEDGSYNEDFNVNYYYNPVGMLEERLGNYTYEETRATGNVTFEPVQRMADQSDGGYQPL